MLYTVAIEGVMATSTTNVLSFPTLKVLQCSDCAAVVMLPQTADIGNVFLLFCDDECEDNFRRNHNIQDEWEHLSA